LWRWTLDLRDGTVTERPLGAVPMELPEVDPRVRGRQHRYVFGARMEGNGEDMAATAVVRHDVQTGTTQVRPLDPGCTAGQPLFVPRQPAGQGEAPEGSVAGGEIAEGDGWLLTVVDDPVRGRSDLLILDAADLCGPAVATVHLPVRLPASLTAYWQPTPGSSR